MALLWIMIDADQQLQRQPTTAATWQRESDDPNNQCDAIIRTSQDLRWKTSYASFCSSSLKQLLHVHLRWHNKHNGWYMDHVSVVLLWLDPPLSILSIPSTLSSHTPTVQSMGMWSHSMLMILLWSRLEKHIRYKWHLKSIDKSGRGERGQRQRLLFVVENQNVKNISYSNFYI